VEVGMDQNSTETSNDRFEIVFRHLAELQEDNAGVDSVAANIRENEGIDELRRLSAEFAEIPKVSYTTT